MSADSYFCFFVTSEQILELFSAAQEYSEIAYSHFTCTLVINLVHLPVSDTKVHRQMSSNNSYAPELFINSQYTCVDI